MVEPLNEGNSENAAFLCVCVPTLTIASNDLKLWVFLFDVLNHVDLEDRVPLRGVLKEREQH